MADSLASSNDLGELPHVLHELVHCSPVGSLPTAPSSGCLTVAEQNTSHSCLPDWIGVFTPGLYL